MTSRFATLVLFSLALCSCMTLPGSRPVMTTAPRAVVPTCPECGRVERIEVTQAVRPTAQGGAVLGGVVGGVLTRQGKNAAASSAGKPTLITYRVTVRTDDGRRLVIHQNAISANLRTGSVVRVSNGRVVLLR